MSVTLLMEFKEYMGAVVPEWEKYMRLAFPLFPSGPRIMK